MTKEDANDSDGFNRVELGATFTDPGATATDASGEATITTSSNVDSDTVGSYEVVYTATDKYGNTSTATELFVSDTTGPVITMTKEDANDSDGFNRVELGETFTDPGATATDASGEATITTSSSGILIQLVHTKLYILQQINTAIHLLLQELLRFRYNRTSIYICRLFFADENQTSIGTVTADDEAILTSQFQALRYLSLLLV